MAILALPAANSANDHLAVLLANRDTRWWKGNLLKLNLILAIVLLTSMTNGYDGSMMNGLQSLETWKTYFNSPQGSTLGLFNAIQNIGSIAALPIAPFIADRFGRRMSIMIGCFIMILGAGVQTGSRSVGMFIGARFCVGFGVAIAGLAAPMLVTELAFPTHRATLTSLYNTSWLLGSIVAAWCTYGTFRISSTWSWRIPSLLQALPSFIQLACLWLIPESPRWLIDRGKSERARATITKYHCQDDPDDPLLEFEMLEIAEAIRIDKESSQSSTYKSLFTTKANLKRMRLIIPIAFFSQWSGNGIVSYYLTLVLDCIGITQSKDQTLINGILNIWNYIGAIVASLIVDRVGRRVLFLTSTGGMCLAFSVWTACYATYVKSDPTNPNTQAGHAVLAFIFIYYAFYVIALTPLVIAYPAEILPYRLRAKGMTVLQLAISCSLTFNQYVNPIALDNIGWKYYLIYCVWLAFEFIYLYIFVIETRGKDGALPLEEIAALFDAADEGHALHPDKGDKSSEPNGSALGGGLDSKVDIDELEQKEISSGQIV